MLTTHLKSRLGPLLLLSLVKHLNGSVWAGPSVDGRDSDGQDEVASSDAECELPQLSGKDVDDVFAEDQALSKIHAALNEPDQPLTQQQIDEILADRDQVPGSEDGFDDFDPALFGMNLGDQDFSSLPSPHFSDLPSPRSTMGSPIAPQPHHSFDRQISRGNIARDFGFGGKRALSHATQQSAQGALRGDGPSPHKSTKRERPPKARQPKSASKQNLDSMSPPKVSQSTERRRVRAAESGDVYYLKDVFNALKIMNIEAVSDVQWSSLQAQAPFLKVADRALINTMLHHAKMDQGVRGLTGEEMTTMENWLRNGTWQRLIEILRQATQRPDSGFVSSAASQPDDAELLELPFQAVGRLSEERLSQSQGDEPVEMIPAPRATSAMREDTGKIMPAERKRRASDASEQADTPTPPHLSVEKTSAPKRKK
jgi:hypothetical protein